MHTKVKLRIKAVLAVMVYSAAILGVIYVHDSEYKEG